MIFKLTFVVPWQLTEHLLVSLVVGRRFRTGVVATYREAGLAASRWRACTSAILT